MSFTTAASNTSSNNFSRSFILAPPVGISVANAGRSISGPESGDWLGPA